MGSEGACYRELWRLEGLSEAQYCLMESRAREEESHVRVVGERADESFLDLEGQEAGWRERKRGGGAGSGVEGKEAGWRERKRGGGKGGRERKRGGGKGSGVEGRREGKEAGWRERKRGGGKGSGVEGRREGKEAG